MKVLTEIAGGWYRPLRSAPGCLLSQIVRAGPGAWRIFATCLSAAVCGWADTENVVGFPCQLIRLDCSAPASYKLTW